MENDMADMPNLEKVTLDFEGGIYVGEASDSVPLGRGAWILHSDICFAHCLWHRVGLRRSKNGARLAASPRTISAYSYAPSVVSAVYDQRGVANRGWSYLCLSLSA